MKALFRVLVADKIPADGLAPLTSDPRFELVDRTGLKGDDLARALAEVDGVIVRSSTTITRDALALTESLKVIGRAGVGVDNIDVDASTEKGIAVFNAPSGNTISAAELTMALLLALVRRVAAADASMRRGEWDRNRFAGTELYGKTLGLVGAGRIGGEVARRARAFGMRVLAYDPYLTEERARQLEIERGDLADVLAKSDVVSLHLPLTEETTGLIGDAQLASMKKSALLINAARGGVVDEAALHRALQARVIAGAALDVYETEPLQADHPLRALENVVLTPHLGAATQEAQQNVAIEIAEVVRNALVEGDLSRAVNAPALGGEEMRRMRPLFALAERLGTLAAGLAGDAVDTVQVQYAGASDGAVQSLAAAALVGVLRGAVGRGAVNMVNALHLAEQRGIEVRRVHLGADDASEYVDVLVSANGRPVSVAGALASQGRPRLTRIDDYRVDIAPRGTLVVLRNRDVPGVIGRVGTLLGTASVNIAEYHQARREAGGEALAAISVDARMNQDVIEKLRALPDVIDARQVVLD
jgi:D-3-phosphoglycerate dehydrogenase / 2-oxoglutarate reductase